MGICLIDKSIAFCNNISVKYPTDKSIFFTLNYIFFV